MGKHNICVVGLGYVGLPLFFELSKYYNVIGFDVNKQKINELKNKYDRNQMFDEKYFNKVKSEDFSSNKSILKKSNIYIICVPTPIKPNNDPDLIFLKNASAMVGSYLSKNDIVIYESTVYPGCTEDYCIPILEKKSNMNVCRDQNNKKGFYVCYSPERINPGDNEHSINKVIKVVSGIEKKSIKTVNDIYKKIIKAGIFIAKDIKTAEAAKIIENTQRDLNIALINEFSIIFDRLGINTYDVLKAAKTKWNFLDFKPGLVGGHCIGVDPYYLTHISKKKKYKPEVILSGRKINDTYHKFIFKTCITEINKRKINKKNCKILIMGFSFKENISDYRNSKVINLIKEFQRFDYNLSIFDPHINISSMDDENLKNCFVSKDNLQKYDIVLIAVGHDIFKNYSKDFYNNVLKKKNLIFDLKNILNGQLQSITI